MLKFVLYFGYFLIKLSAGDDGDGWKLLSYSTREDSNKTIKSCHISWIDEFDDSFSYAFTNENSSNLNFMFDKPKPELFVSNNFIEDSFNKFLDFMRNQTKIDSVRVTLRFLEDEMTKIINKKEINKKPKIEKIQINSYDQLLITKIMNLIKNIPRTAKISFYNFDERTEKVFDSRILFKSKLEKVAELDLRTIESDLTDDELQLLNCKSINVRSSTITNQGINEIFKKWQNGLRQTQYLKVIGDDLQKAEIMNGIIKKTIQRGVWEIKNRFNVTARVTFSRLPNDLYDAKPTVEFSVS